MALQGTIKDFGLADIFQLIGIQRKTGTLTLQNDGEAVSVKFQEGQVVGAESAQRNMEDLLGSVLVRTGRITERQLQDSLKHQKKTLQRMGYILVKNGYISEEDVKEALQIQVTQIIYRLFRWRAGKYQFLASEQVDYDRDFTPMSAETILMEGARMLDEWPILERRIRSSAMVFRRTAAGDALEGPVDSPLDPEFSKHFEMTSTGGRQGEAEGIRLSPDERQILRLVDGRSRVQDLVDRSALGEFDTYRLVYELLNRNLIEEVRSGGAGALARVEGRRLNTGRWLVAVVFLVAALSLATLPLNSLTPWRLAAAGGETDRLKAYASRGRLERIERAIEVFYLDMGSMPVRLDLLTDGSYLDPSDLLDPWGRGYIYQLKPGAFLLAGLDGASRPSEALSVHHRFSPTQRMVLEGGAFPGKVP